MQPELIAKEVEGSFGLLTPADFEWLSAEVVRGNLKGADRRLRDFTYPPGKEGGVDWCFEVGERSFVVQSAHYKDEKNLKQKVKDEIIKMFKQPYEIQGRAWSYIFCVSCALKKSLRVEIQEMFKAFEQIPGYISDSLEILDANDLARIISSSDVFIDRWGRLSPTLAEARMRTLGIEQWLSASRSHSDKFRGFCEQSIDNELIQEEFSKLIREVVFGLSNGRYVNSLIHIVPSDLNDMYLHEDLFCHYVTSSIGQNFVRKNEHSVIPKNLFLDAVDIPAANALSILHSQLKKANQTFGTDVKFSLLIEYSDLHGIPANDVKHLLHLCELNNLCLILKARHNPHISPAPISQQVRMMQPIKGLCVLMEWKVEAGGNSIKEIACTVAERFLQAIRGYNENESLCLFDLAILKHKAFDPGLFQNLHPAIEAFGVKYEMVNELRSLLLTDWMEGGIISEHFGLMLSKYLKQGNYYSLMSTLLRDDQIRSMPGGGSIYPAGFSNFLRKIVAQRYPQYS